MNLSKEQFLIEVQKTICGPREKEYGSPIDNFSLIAELWSLYLGVRITPEQHAVCMQLVKVARLKTTPGHKDSHIDMAGYAACAGTFIEETEAQTQTEGRILAFKVPIA